MRATVSWWPLRLAPRMRLPSAASASAAEHILERLGVDRPDDPVEGRPGGRLAQPRPRVPPMASSSFRDSDRANCAAAFHVRKLGENVSTPCASCAAEVLDRRSSSCSERITSEPRGTRRQAAPGSACGRDSSRRAAQRKSPCHGGRCSARWAGKSLGPAHASPPPYMTRFCPRDDAIIHSGWGRENVDNLDCGGAPGPWLQRDSAPLCEHAQGSGVRGSNDALDHQSARRVSTISLAGGVERVEGEQTAGAVAAWTAAVSPS